MTQHKTAGDALHVERAEGAILHVRKGDVEGQTRPIIDGVSSWWVNTHGHCHPKIVKAVQEQAAKLEQVIFAGFTHDPAEKLTRKLISTVRTEFRRCEGSALEFAFYSDSGSTSIEIALKMAIGYFAEKGEKRHRIIALDGGYHGDTFGTMSTGSRGVFNEQFEPFLFDVKHMPFPRKGIEGKVLSYFNRYLKKYGSEVAAFVFEPLVQGAAGMRIYSPAVLKKMASMCREHGILLIADEVMTGFGRTGSMFACSKAGFKPDLLCLSKGITGGFLPMGATLATREIYKAFYKDTKAEQFFHSTSFTANPMACAAAVASLEIWEEEPVLENIQRVCESHRRAAGWFSARPDVAEVRVKGSIFAVEVEDDNGGYLSDMAQPLYDFMLDNGVLLRPIGNIAYILPPYCIKEEELEKIYETLWRGLDMVRDRGKKKASEDDGRAANEHKRYQNVA